MTEPGEAGDPPPVAPREPEPGECCQSGCDPCVYDLYNDAMDRYDAALAAWRRRHATLDAPPVVPQDTD